MSLVDDKTAVTALPSLDFFAKTFAQDTYNYTYSDSIRPIAQLNSGPHIEFQINTAENEYIRLKDTTLYIKFLVKLAKSDNSAIAAEDWGKVSVCNNLLHSLWSQIDLSIGETNTCVSLQTYSYRAYFDTILGSTEQGRKTFLKLSGFLAEELSDATKDLPNAKFANNIKWKSGDKDKGRVCELIGKLHLDLMLQHRDLLGNCKIKLKLIQNRPEFYFITNDEKLLPSIHFEDVQLRLLKSKANQDIINAHNVTLDIGLIKYIINRTEVRTFSIDKDITTKTLENVIIGQIPRRIYVAFVENSARSGSFKQNPFFFGNFNLSSIVCFVNGTPYPKDSYKPDYKNDIYATELTELYRNSEQFNNEVRTLITPENYKNGYNIYSFNISQDYSQGYNSCGYTSVPKNGVLRFEITFSEKLSKTIDALVYCEFDNLISLGPERSAIMDYR